MLDSVAHNADRVFVSVVSLAQLDLVRYVAMRLLSEFMGLLRSACALIFTDYMLYSLL